MSQTKNSSSLWISLATIVGIAAIWMHAGMDSSPRTLRSVIPEDTLHQAHNYANLYHDRDVAHSDYLHARQDGTCTTDPCNRMNTLCSHDLPTTKYMKCACGGDYMAAYAQCAATCHSLPALDPIKQLCAKTGFDKGEGEVGLYMEGTGKWSPALLEAGPSSASSYPTRGCNAPQCLAAMDICDPNRYQGQDLLICTCKPSFLKALGECQNFCITAEPVVTRKAYCVAYNITKASPEDVTNQIVGAKPSSASSLGMSVLLLALVFLL